MASIFFGLWFWPLPQLRPVSCRSIFIFLHTVSCVASIRASPPKWQGPLVYLCFSLTRQLKPKLHTSLRNVDTITWRQINKDPRSGFTNGLLGIRFICTECFSLFFSRHLIVVIPEERPLFQTRSTRIKRRKDAMQLDIVIGEKEDGVFYFFHFSSLSLCLSSPPDKPQYAISFRAMHYYTWIRIIKRQSSRNKIKRSKPSKEDPKKHDTRLYLYSSVLDIDK